MRPKTRRAGEDSAGAARAGAIRDVGSGRPACHGAVASKQQVGARGKLKQRQEDGFVEKTRGAWWFGRRRGQVASQVTNTGVRPLVLGGAGTGGVWGKESGAAAATSGG